MAASAPSNSNSNSNSIVQWYFYLQNDPRGMLPDGWHPYDSYLSMAVEQLYQNNRIQRLQAKAGKAARQVVPLHASSGYQYEIDFHRMTQRNTQSGKTRPIARTDNGFPPPPSHSSPSGSTRRSARLPNFLSGRRSSSSNYNSAGVTSAFAPAASNSSGAVAAATAPPSTADSSNSNTSGSNNRYAHVSRLVYSTDGTQTDELTYTAPDQLHQEVFVVDESKIFNDLAGPPASETDDAHEEDECAICLDNMWGQQKGTADDSTQHQRVVALKACSHQFHYDCIHNAIMASGKCPLCNLPVQQQQNNDDDQQHQTTTTPKGKCPSGTMTIKLRNYDKCQGYPPGVLQITYIIPDGVQKSYHPLPGTAFAGAHRIAYLPNTTEGQDLLVRMQYAFGHGLIFMVGTSLTSGRTNCVVWASIHHKTSLSGGTSHFGFPDDTYFDRCHGELDAAGVPNTADCKRWYDNVPLVAS